ncbi:unnamed protein product [Rotaria magnacalcarata]|uniref:NAD(P)(+)--arginine ADP-ribosyltransferase n=1 Tax=Rotaria magnacalcarata TaxID=392030 RepID=A0A820BW41_9BILA|nr:unnamed protein product [Rotaria magnacalcarata]CAF4214013.1 unnamed protein product [Rotaria magnacalcarata]
MGSPESKPTIKSVMKEPESKSTTKSIMKEPESKPTTKFVMKEDEAKRLKGRHTNVDLFKQLQEASSHNDDPKARAAHCCYVHLIGIIPDFENRLNSTEITSDKAEKYIEETVLYQNVSKLAKKRTDYAVFEDNFGPTIDALVKRDKRPSFASLYDACSKYDRDGYMQMHLATSQKSWRYFLDKGVSSDEAQACAFAIAFYTGSYSETVNQNAAFVARNQNRNTSTNAEMSKLDDRAAIIMYYLIKGLPYINFYWGIATRCVQLKTEELADYQPGVLITWLQFSSSNKGLKTAEWFNDRNTIFIIYSLTGRSIQQFSNCAEDEDEILFLPHSSFMVCKVEHIHNQYRIHLRQLELGLCQNVILWVDDHIFDDWWENKEHMEKASTVGTQINVHFIPKSNTETAIAFLRSEFGERQKNSPTFRIVTDMNRENETPADNAGIRLIVALRELGYNSPCLIFTGDAYAAQEKLNKMLPENQQHNINITESISDLENFVNFQ